MSAGHAVVLGAGFAGMLSARVLSEHFTRVTLVERDALDGAVMRRGVPQARHLHGLLDRGRTILEDLHPGFTAQAAAAGAATAEALIGTRWYLSGLRVRPTETGLTSLMATRPLLESLLRERTLAASNIALLEQHTARGLIGSADRVGGVILAHEDVERTLEADLVIDATGRASRTPDWLRALGATAPAEDRVEVDLGYSSRFYRRTPDHLDGQSSVIVSTGPNGRGGGAIRVEGDRWHVTLAGMLGDHPPTDPAEFTAFAATIAAPDIHRIITTAEPLSEPVPHRFRYATRRRFERGAAAAPAGFLALGDAVCGFNPLYAQGMTVAAQQAQVLRECLDGGLDGLPARFYTRAARVLDVAWSMSTGSDLRYPGVVGARTARVRMTNAYVGAAHRAAHTDPAIARAFLRVANLVDPPAALLRPAAASRILLPGRRNHR